MRILSRRAFMQVAAAVFAATQVAAAAVPDDPTQLSIRVYPCHVEMRMRVSPTGSPIEWRVGDEFDLPSIRCREDQLDLPQFKTVETQMSDGTVLTHDYQHNRSNGATLNVIRLFSFADGRPDRYYGVTTGRPAVPLTWWVVYAEPYEVVLRCLLPPSHREPIKFERIVSPKFADTVRNPYPPIMPEAA